MTARLVHRATNLLITLHSKGNGRVGLIYIYTILKNNKELLHFVQFTSDGSTFTPQAATGGPESVSLDSLQLVMGKLNSDG
jgi:hypothetical protein